MTLTVASEPDSALMLFWVILRPPGRVIDVIIFKRFDIPWRMALSGLLDTQNLRNVFPHGKMSKALFLIAFWDILTYFILSGKVCLISWFYRSGSNHSLVGLTLFLKCIYRWDSDPTMLELLENNCVCRPTCFGRWLFSKSCLVKATNLNTLFFKSNLFLVL